MRAIDVDNALERITKTVRFITRMTEYVSTKYSSGNIIHAVAVAKRR